MEIGNLVRYKSLPECIGFVIEIRPTMIKVKWNEGDIVEWMPLYALEIVNV